MKLMIVFMLMVCFSAHGIEWVMVNGRRTPIVGRVAPQDRGKIFIAYRNEPYGQRIRRNTGRPIPQYCFKRIMGVEIEKK